MTFTPINRTDDFTTISYNDLWERCSGDRYVIHAALIEGALTALLQVEGEAESRFYKVPKNHWRDDSIMEGEPGQTLFCWGTSNVPAKFDNRPLLFFVDDVEEWEARRSAPKEHVPGVWSGPESLAESRATFEECLAKAGKPSDGYWSPFATLAWIASRDERFVAATQTYEVQNYAEREAHCAFVWRDLGTLLGERFGKTYSDAETELRGELEAGRLVGGIATDLGTGKVDELPRFMWTKWKRSFERVGVVLVPGYSDFKWPAESVRAAFPTQVELAAAAPQFKFTTQAEVERWYNDRVATWADAEHPSRDDDIAAGRSVGLSPDRVRGLRAKLAPPGWKVGGRRPGT